MKVFFGAQSGFFNIFQQLDIELRKDHIVDKSAYFVSDSQYYFSPKEKFPLINDGSVEYLFEWEYTSRNRIKTDSNKLDKIKLKYKKCNLWNSIVCDRRLMYGEHTKFRQSYKGKFSDEKLQNIIYESLYAIEQVIKKNKPDFIMTLVPSTFGDYLLYYAAQVNDIKYLQLKFTKIYNNILLSESFGASSCEIVDFYNKNIEKEHFEFKTESIEYLKKSQSMPVQYEGAVDGKAIGTITRFKNLIKAFLSIIKNSAAKNRSVISADNHVPPVYSMFWYLHLMRDVNKCASLTAMKQRSLSIDQVENIDYVFFPLHSEPEIALLVNGINYQNQIELIRRLAQSIPLDWKLIVKEHPNSTAYRSSGYYSKLLQIPNLYFADLEDRPFHWIKKSKLVTTISGFVGFEAAMLKVPVIVFGDVMFDMLPRNMVRKVDILSMLHREICDLVNNYDYDEKAMTVYIAACLNLSVPVNVYSVLLGKQGRVSIGNSDDAKNELLKFSEYVKGILTKEINAI